MTGWRPREELKLYLKILIGRLVEALVRIY